MFLTFLTMFSFIIQKTKQIIDSRKQVHEAPVSITGKQFQYRIENDTQLKETIYDIIKTIKDPEKPATLEELNVVREDDIHVMNVDPCNARLVRVEFSPTIPHCNLATLIGLCIRAKIQKMLNEELKVDIYVKEGTHSTELEINKQVNDKERVAAAMENPNLLQIVNECIKETE